LVCAISMRLVAAFRPAARVDIAFMVFENTLEWGCY
jgi:uncharacterized membrane protein YcjF (UPF0283 family)